MNRPWIVVGMIALVLGVALGVVVALDRPDLIDTHRTASSLPSTACMGCHGTKTSGSVDPMKGIEETSLNPDIKTVHARHLDNPLLGIECTTCHESVDLVEGSAAHLRKQVNVNICLTCHEDLFAPAPAEAPVVATLPAGYSEFSLPYNYGAIDAANVLGVSAESLKLATASGATSAADFSFYPEAPADQFTPGIGYQITLTEPVSITMMGDAVTQPTVRVLARQGWNLIGTPYLQAVRWDDVKVETASAQVLTISEAERAGILAKVLWVYDAASNDYQTSDVMEPFKAYWIQTFEDVTLLIPRPF